MSVGPIGVSGPAGPFGAFHMPSTTGVVPLQWKVTFRPETCGKRPVAIAGSQTGENPFRNACLELGAGEREDHRPVAERQHGEHLAPGDLAGRLARARRRADEVLRAGRRSS